VQYALEFEQARFCNQSIYLHFKLSDWTLSRLVHCPCFATEQQL
jgi:hypothetical protein